MHRNTVAGGAATHSRGQNRSNDEMFSGHGDNGNFDDVMDALGKDAPSDSDVVRLASNVSATQRIERMLNKSSTKETFSQKHWLLDHVVFQAACGGFVFLNTVQMGFEAEVGKDAYPRMFNFSEHVFAGAFFTEMIIKLVFLRGSYFRDTWNWLDAFISIAGVLDVWVLALVAPGNTGLSSLSILRVLRLVRLVRIMKLMKQFKKIVVIINGVVDAIRTTLWVALLLFGAIYVCAIFCVDVIGRVDNVAELYPGYEMDESEFANFEVFSEFNPYLSFGSLFGAMLTLFNIAILAEWTEVIRPVSVKQPYLVVFFILYGLFITFGVMNVIIGLIVDNVMANARSMTTEEESKETNDKIRMLRTIDQIYHDLDSDGNGVVTIEEIVKSGKNGPLATLMEEGGIGIDITQEEFFDVLDDDGDGKVSADTFVQALYKLLGVDQNRQLNILLLALKQVLHTSRSSKDQCEARLDRIEASINTMMDSAGIGKLPPHVSPPACRDATEARPDEPHKSRLEVELTDEPSKYEEALESVEEVTAKQEKLVHRRCLVAENAQSKQDMYSLQEAEFERLGRALEGMRRLDSDGAPHMDSATARSMEQVSRVLEAARREAEDAIQCKLRQTIAGCLRVVEHAVETPGIELPNVDLRQLNQLAQAGVVPPSAGNAHVYPPGSRGAAGSAASSSLRTTL